jgi:DHA3 family macrolide efflux protein-like MFS transporter
MPIGIMLFGPLADAVSVESILILTGILLVLVAVWYERSSKRVEFPIDKNRVA